MGVKGSLLGGIKGQSDCNRGWIVLVFNYVEPLVYSIE